MAQQLFFIINGPTNWWWPVLGVSILVTIFSLLNFIADLGCKKFGKISFICLIVSIIVSGICVYCDNSQCSKRNMMLNNIAKKYPKITIAVINNNDQIIYLKKHVNHNTNNIVKNETGYEIQENSNNNDQYSSPITVQKVKPQVIEARIIKENQNAKNTISAIN